MLPLLSRFLIALVAVLALASCGADESGEHRAESLGQAVDPATGRAATEGAAASLWSGEPVDNVVLITIDTLRYDALGFTGSQGVETPAIDSLAASGWVFDNAYAHSVVTLPSHSNILSGRYPYEHGVRENSGFVFPAEMDSAATLLSGAGFASAAVVGAFPLSSRYGLDRGFDLYDDEYSKGWGSHTFDVPERPGTEVIKRSLAWWNANEGKRRFLWAHLYDPHAPYAAPEPWASRYPEERYLAEVAATDAHLAPLLEQVVREEAGRTLIILTGDHGEALGDHGERTHGFFVYESTLKVPLLIWAPGLEARRFDHLARHVDILPTILEATGVGSPADLSGASLWRPPPAGEERVSYMEALSSNLNRGWAPLRGMMSRDLKFISVPIPEYYDLESDPAELVNLFDERRAEAQQFVRQLPKEAEWPPTRGSVTQEEREALLSLGYLSNTAARKASYGPEDDPKQLVEIDEMLYEVIDAWSRGDFDTAEATVRKALAARPMVLGYKLLAKIQLATNRRGEAIESLESAIATGFADMGIVRELGLTLTAVGRAPEAVRLLSTARSSGDPDDLNALASALIETGDLAGAEKVLEQSLASEPVHPITHETLALLALRRENWGAVKVAAQKALSVDDTLSLAWNYLGGALYNEGSTVAALDAWQKSVDNDGTNYDAMFNIAVIAGSIGDRPRARTALERFIREAPSASYGPDIQRARAWLAELGG